MPKCDFLVRNVTLIDGTGELPRIADVAVKAGIIHSIGPAIDYMSEQVIDGAGLALAPGFIDTHTHDDLFLIRSPQMLPKLSQGVTTVVVGNCGISGAPYVKRELPEPLNLLGEPEEFRFPTFETYVEAVETAKPAVNVAALVGHTALRSNHMDRLDRTASAKEIEGMRGQLCEALEHGALGLSTGLAYRSANHATTEEVVELGASLGGFGGIYATHMRTEAAEIRQAMDEAFKIGRECGVHVVISHVKCSGIDNWGRAPEILGALRQAAEKQEIGCDCYPYSATSTVLDPGQIDERVKVVVTWSRPHPEMSGKSVAEIAEEWHVSQSEAAERLRPAGAIYYTLSEDDMRKILCDPATMIGSDGLPSDPHPHPRLWGTFPRVLGRYSRELGLLAIQDAVHKMTGLPARRFGLKSRGFVREGYHADLVLFNPETVLDRATFEEPTQVSAGIEAVWVNGALSFQQGSPTGARNGHYLPRA